MNCPKCHKDLNGYEKFCPYCGNTIVKPITQTMPVDEFRKSTEGSRIASIILGGLSLGGAIMGIFAPIALILSIIGLILAIKSNRNAKNTIGIVLNAIGMLISLVITLIIAFIVYIFINTSSGIFDNIRESYNSTYNRENF